MFDRKREATAPPRATLKLVVVFDGIYTDNPIIRLIESWEEMFQALVHGTTARKIRPDTSLQSL